MPDNTPLIYSRQVEIEVYPPCLSCLSLAIILFSSFRFRLIGSTGRNRFIGFWLYTPFRVLKWCFHLRWFSLVCLLIARVYHARTLSHYVISSYLQSLAVLTIAVRLCGVVAICLLATFSCNEKSVPCAPISDSASQTWFSLPLAACTTIQFSKERVTISRDKGIMPNAEISL